MERGRPLSWLVDTDPGLGLLQADVDDALALVHLAAWGVPVAGLTTTYGNASLAATTRVARGLGARFGWPVHAGARGPGDVDTAAVAALVAHRGPVLAIGPLTNVAAALARGAAWERLVVLGGTDRRLPNLRPLHTTELNLAVDEPAARRALARTDVLCPMEPCRRVWFGAAELAAAPAWLADGCRRWLWGSPLRTGRRAFHPWDLLPAMHLTHPALFVVERRAVVLNSRPLWRGAVRYPGPGPVEVIVDVDVAGLRAVWRETLARCR